MADQIRFKVYVKERERALSIVAEEYDVGLDFARFLTADRLVAIVPTPMLIAITQDEVAAAMQTAQNGAS